ncbi:Protein DMR6-LIKE OXYGENASE 1 [Linum perenne]
MRKVGVSFFNDCPMKDRLMYACSDVVSQYSDEMNVLTKKLLGIISESLGVQSSCIEDVVGEFYQNITVSYYPPCPRPELTLGLQSHSDFGALTLLIQDQVSGLEVLKDSHWFPVQPLPEAIVVLVSDQTEVCNSAILCHEDDQLLLISSSE